LILVVEKADRLHSYVNPRFSGVENANDDEFKNTEPKQF
jgi:hypothetical protein